MKEKTTKDIQTRQQIGLSGLCQRKRRRGNQDRKGGEPVEKVIDFICWAALISFALLFAIGTIFVVGYMIYFCSKYNQLDDIDVDTEQQRIEDEIQIQALKNEAEKKRSKKKAKEERRKKRWKKRNS